MDTEFAWAHNAETDGVVLLPADALAGLWVRKGFARVDVDLDAAALALGFPLADLRQVPESYVRQLVAAPEPAPESPAAEPDEVRTTPEPQPETATGRRRTSKES